MPRWDDHDPTDLEELTRWATLIIVGGTAILIIIGLIVLALWAL